MGLCVHNKVCKFILLKPSLDINPKVLVKIMNIKASPISTDCSDAVNTNITNLSV